MAKYFVLKNNGRDEAGMRMEPEEVQERNNELKQSGESARWVLYRDERKSGK